MQKKLSLPEIQVRGVVALTDKVCVFLVYHLRIRLIFCKFDCFNNRMNYLDLNLNIGGIQCDFVGYGKFGRPANVPFP